MNCESYMKECRFDLMPFLKNEDACEDFEYMFDLSEFGPNFSDVHFVGVVKNIAGAVVIKAKITATYITECDRCLDKVIIPLTSYLDTIVSDDASKDDSITFVSGKVDFIKTAYDALSLELPLIVHCSEDCKGICQACGVNLNNEQCKCEQ